MSLKLLPVLLRTCVTGYIHRMLEINSNEAAFCDQHAKGWLMAAGSTDPRTRISLPEFEAIVLKVLDTAGSNGNSAKKTIIRNLINSQSETLFRKFTYNDGSVKYATESLEQGAEQIWLDIEGIWVKLQM